MKIINDWGRRAAALALAASFALSAVPPVLAADADEVEPPAAQTEQQETDTEADEADVDTEADEAAALPELSEDREVAEEDEAAALPELSEDREVAEEDEAAALPELSEDREVAEEDEAAADGDVDTCGVFHTCTFDELIEQKDPTCTEGGYKKYQCTHVTTIGKKKIRCTKTKTDKYAALGHKFTDYKVTKEVTEGADGEQIAVCDHGCGKKDTQIIHYYGEWKVTKEPTCYAKGEKQRTCLNCGYVETAEIKTIPHTWGEYVDDDKPGCQQQTATAHCTREGCTATDTKDLPNFGPDGNPLPHRYTAFQNPVGIGPAVLKFEGVCDYCGEKTTFSTVPENGSDEAKKKAEENARAWSSYWSTQKAMENVKVDDVAADQRINQIIDDALKAAQDAVKQAKTKEEAIAALDQISATVRSELVGLKITAVGLDVPVEIKPEDLEPLLKPLDTTIESLKESLDGSFLSQKTISNLVDKLATDVPASNAPETGIKKVLHSAVYDIIYNLTAKDDEKKTTDSMPDVKNMVLQLVSDVAKSDEGWDSLTDTLVDDAVELALDEVMKDKTYAMLLKTKLGASTVEEVRAEIKKQLVNDPTFMNSVREQVKTAADEASKGVSQGWSDQKVLDRLQANLLPISGLVANKIDELGSSAGNIADNKVDDTVHKFLPGKLGDWVSDKVGSKVNNIVQNKVNNLGGQVTDIIDSFIKQFTCGNHHMVEKDEVILKAATCTEKGEKGEKCRNCGKIENKTEIPALDHAWVIDPAVEPTETSVGYTQGSHCSRCGAVQVAQETIPMLDPTIDTWFSRAATTEADAKAAGFDSVEAANAALDAALTAAGFDPANAEHFTVQVNSSIGVLPNDRFSESGVTGKLTLPEGTRGKTAQTYYAVQMFTADTRFHKAGDVVVTPVSIDTYAKTGLQFTVYSEAVMAIAWKAQ